MSVSPQQKTQLIFFNSKYATKANNGSANSDVSFLLPRPVQKPTGTNIALKVQQLVYPVSFYSVNDTNNKLVYFSGGLAQTDVVVPKGNYTATELLDYLNGTNGLVGSITATYDEKTLKFTFTDPTPDAIELDSTSTCLSLLGFTEGADHTSTLVGGVHALTSQHPINLLPTKCLYLSIPNLSTNNLNGHTGQRTPVLASVPVSEAQGDVAVYTNNTGLESYTQEDTISEFHVKILGEDLVTLVDFNNQHWHLTLQLTFTPT